MYPLLPIPSFFGKSKSLKCLMQSFVFDFLMEKICSNEIIHIILLKDMESCIYIYLFNSTCTNRPVLI